MGGSDLARGWVGGRLHLLLAGFPPWFITPTDSADLENNSARSSEETQLILSYSQYYGSTNSFLGQDLGRARCLLAAEAVVTAS